MQDLNRTFENLLELNAVQFYDKQEYEIYEEDAFGNKMAICGMRTKLPQLIVKQWLSILLAEKPTFHNLKTNKEDNSNAFLDINIDLNLVMHDVLAYGSCFVIPMMIDNKIVFDIKVENKDPNAHLEYIEHLGELKLLAYSEEFKKFDMETRTTIEDTYKHIHTYDNGKYTYMIISESEDKIIQSTEYAIDQMLPFKITNRTFGPYGKAIFYDAIPYIINFDNTFNANNSDRELSKPLLLLPSNLTKSELDLDDNGKPVISTEYLGFKRLLRLIPSDDESDRLVPIEWRGGWQPAPYHDDMDVDLHMISLQSGFGTRYFSFDKNEGFKTATEVVSEKDDLYKNKMMLDAILAEIIHRAYYAEVVLSETKSIKYLDVEQMEVTFSDSIITDDKAKRDQLYKDLTAGALTEEAYLELAGYPQDVIDKVNASKVAPLPEGI